MKKGINQFNSAICCACPKHRPGLSTAYTVVLSVFSESMWEVIVRFADIGEIDDHHCSTFFP